MSGERVMELFFDLVTRVALIYWKYKLFRRTLGDPTVTSAKMSPDGIEVQKNGQDKPAMKKKPSKQAKTKKSPTKAKAKAKPGPKPKARSEPKAKAKSGTKPQRTSAQSIAREAKPARRKSKQRRPSSSEEVAAA